MNAPSRERDAAPPAILFDARPLTGDDVDTLLAWWLAYSRRMVATAQARARAYAASPEHCAHCGAELPEPTREEMRDPVVQAFGRVCEACYFRQERER